MGPRRRASTKASDATAAAATDGDDSTAQGASVESLNGTTHNHFKVEAEKLVAGAISLFGAPDLQEDDYLDSYKLKTKIKISSEYQLVKELVAETEVQSAKKRSKTNVGIKETKTAATTTTANTNSAKPSFVAPAPPTVSTASSDSAISEPSDSLALTTTGDSDKKSFAIVVRKKPNMPKPQWHAPWKLSRVISGHQGWVRAVAVDVANEWFATGSVDRTLKIWDLASGELKLTLTGHISTIRGIAISPRHPYLFTCGEDKQIKCWDLEQNKVIRQYFGHLSGVYCIGVHPTLDIIATGGRDACCRIWDMRTKFQVHCLTGHSNTVYTLSTNSTSPQIITGSMDTTCKLWDLRGGHAYATLTHHKKSVRALANHPTLHGFATGSADNIKEWKCPDGEFIQNLEGHNAVINTLAINQDGVVVSCGDNGSMQFWDWKTAHPFCTQQTRVQPGSLDSEAGIFASCFDQTGTRLITGEADKTIKVWKEDENATPETHPVEWQAPAPWQQKRY